MHPACAPLECIITYVTVDPGNYLQVPAQKHDEQALLASKDANAFTGSLPESEFRAMQELSMMCALAME